MTLMVDTSVWSLALRRDAPPDIPEVAKLAEALADQTTVVATGLILQELLQGFLPASAQTAIQQHFAAVDLVEPRRADYEAAATVRNTCRRAGVQIGTIDALIIQLCLANDLMLLTTDQDFHHATKVTGLKLWSSR